MKRAHCISAMGRFSVNYYNMYKLMEQFSISRIASIIAKFFDRLAAVNLLNLDDFGMKKLDGQQLQDFMKLIEDQYGRKGSHSKPIGSD